jgi:hypothetical protein
MCLIFEGRAQALESESLRPNSSEALPYQALRDQSVTSLIAHFPAQDAQEPGAVQSDPGSPAQCAASHPARDGPRAPGFDDLLT